MHKVFTTLQRGLRPGMQVLIALALVVGMLGAFVSQSATAAVPIPVFSVIAVEKDNLVTIKTYNFPANRTFIVRMGAYGTLGIGGTEVATTYSGTGGTFTATYSIPAALKGSARLAIRLDATSGGYYSYNWFWNNTGAVPPAPGYTGIPTFQIMTVVKDATVVIKTNNFPANRTFIVRMGKYGTLGIGGIVVGTTFSEGGGRMTISYPIPAELKGQARIAIRMDATSGGFYSYNWFWNDPSATSGGSTYVGIPTFAISSVVKNASVTITTNNFPANRTFVVRMGKYGTLGIGGIVVATTDSGTGGTFTATYAIPAELQGQGRIAIRMDATSGGFLSYNWFWNN
jgi:hypothetical protein